MSRRTNLWLLLGVAVCAGSFLLGRNLLGPRSGWGGPAGAAGTAGTEGPAVRLLVLNGTSQDGLARSCGLLLSRAGLAPVGFENAPGQDVERTFLVNRRLTALQAEDLAGRLGGIPVIGEFDPRGVEDAVLVLGGDHARLTDSLAGRGQ